jgi:phosphatidylglycerophosphatase A
MTLARFIASGLGGGFFPIAAGTFGSLVGLAIGAVLLVVAGNIAVLAAALAATIAGVWAINASGAGENDPGWVVIDEIAGQLLALLPLARPTPLGLLAAFILFRFFDITKLGPIGWADRRHDALGVMGDDVIAGLVSAVLLWGAGFLIPTLTG